MCILDTESDARFDRITALVARMFDVDTCLFSLVDSQRQWIKSRQGFSMSEIPRSVSFCGHALLDDRVFHVEDASQDSRFADNPLVQSGPEIRFYAGFPVRCPLDHRVGTICIMDKQPRELSQREHETLRDLAAVIEDELYLGLQSTVDDLTQVLNLRGFKNITRHLLALCRRVAAPAHVALFDIDDLTGINATQGFEAGNRMLQYFAVLMCRCFRTADVIARIDGGKFVVFFAASDISTEAALERLASLAKSERDAIDGELSWSVSRVAVDPDEHSTIDALLADARRKMSEDKLKKRQAGEVN